MYEDMGGSVLRGDTGYLKGWVRVTPISTEMWHTHTHNVFLLLTRGSLKRGEGPDPKGLPGRGAPGGHNPQNMLHLVGRRLLSGIPLKTLDPLLNTHLFLTIQGRSKYFL